MGLRNRNLSPCEHKRDQVSHLSFCQWNTVFFNTHRWKQKHPKRKSPNANRGLSNLNLKVNLAFLFWISNQNPNIALSLNPKFKSKSVFDFVRLRDETYEKQAKQQRSVTLFKLKRLNPNPFLFKTSFKEKTLGCQIVWRFVLVCVSV